MKKLRLLITEDCNRTCAGCCNKDWDLNALPVCTDYTGYDEILLTGGEPLLNVSVVLKLVEYIRKNNPRAKIVLYTAFAQRVLHVLPWIDGVTITLHDNTDVPAFQHAASVLREMHLDHVPYVKSASLRLNVFKGVSIGYVSSMWKVKPGMEWAKDSPLPTNEVFMRVQS